MAGVIKNL